jgi:hypothetical protein
MYVYISLLFFQKTTYIAMAENYYFIVKGPYFLCNFLTATY